MKHAVRTARGKPTPEGSSPEGRRCLLENGFEPILLNGAAPISTGWQKGAVTPNRLTEWESENPRGGNTGLRTGKLVVFDVDLEDPVHAETVGDAIQGVLGISEFRRIGQKGFHLCYRNAEEPLRKICVAGRLPGEDKPRPLVEIMGQGQQVAVYGLHPKSGEPYRWPSDSPLDAPLEDLPQVSRAELRRAAQAARDALEEIGAQGVRITGDTEDGPREVRPVDGEAPVTADMLRDMLAYVDPACSRVEWIGWLGAIMESPLVDTAGDPADDFDRDALAVAWSAGELSTNRNPGNYQGAEDVARAVESLGRYSGKPKALGSLIEEARRNGYAGPTLAYAEEELAALRAPEEPAIERLAKARGLKVIGGTCSQPVANDDIPDDAEPAVNRWPSLIYRGDALASIKPPVPIIPGYLLSRGVTALLAPRRSGKTIIALDLGLCLSTDSPWAGEAVAPGWHVVYLCGEDYENAAAHVQAWAKVHSSGKVPERFTFVRDVPNLLSRSNGDVSALIETLRGDIPEGARVLWIVDTWQRATTGGGQNEDADMKAAFRNLETLADSYSGAAIGCFHPPKDNAKTISGVAFQENAAAAMLYVEKTEPEKPESERKLTVANIKGRGEGNYKAFRFREVEIGEPDSTFGQRPVGIVAEHSGGTGESRILKVERQRREREEADKLADDTLTLVTSLLGDGWRVLGSNRGGGAGALKPSDIAKRLKVHPEKVEKALAQLMADGRLDYREAHGKAKASYIVPEVAVENG